MIAPISNRLSTIKYWILPLVGGSLSGLFLGWAGVQLSRLAVGSDLAAIGPILLGMLVGYILGVTLGIFYTLRYLRQKVSFWWALVGSSLGGILLMVLEFSIGQNLHPALMTSLIFTFPPILSLVLGRKIERKRNIASDMV